MSDFFYIKIANGLLEPKHCLAMGEAVWLYMWLQDKTTSINENQLGKVLGNKPIVYEKDIKPVLGISRYTYIRWVEKLRDAGYIQTIRTPRGLVIIVTKAKKFNTKRSVKTAHHSEKVNSDVAQSHSDVAQSPPEVSKSHIQYKTKTRTITKTKTINTKATKSPKHEEISKLYYQAIKALSLPVLNHNTLRAKIKQMTTEVEHDKLKGYLTFIRDQYPSIQIDYKPHLNNSLDIYNKRVQIENCMRQAAKEQEQQKVFRV
jgi:hypothetical protein